MNWWKRLFSGPEQSSQDEQSPNTVDQTAQWIDADSEENLFGVRLVNLMQNLQLLSTSQKESEAATAISWRPGQHERLAIQKSGDGIPCDLRYPIGSCLPDGMLFIPRAMEDKWVIAWRDGAVVFARSWSGETMVTADAILEDQELRIHRLYIEEEMLSAFGDPVTVVDWIMRSHAMEERLPLPVDEDVADFLYSVPLMAMNVFGHRLFCAGIDYSMPQPSGLLYSDGEVAAAVYNDDVETIRRVASATAWQTPTRHEGAPPLVLASTLGHTDLCRVMLELGADVNMENARGGNALQAGIVSRCGTDHAAMLLASGARTDDANEDGFTAVHAAAEVDDADMIRFLAGHGANIEAQTNAGFRAIHIAAGLGHQASAQALVECGVSINVAGNGRSAEQIAREEGKDELATWFAELSKGGSD